MFPQWKIYFQHAEALSRRLSSGEVQENGLEAVGNCSELQGGMGRRSGHQGDFLKRKIPESNQRPYVFLECFERSCTKVSTICLKSYSNHPVGRKTHFIKTNI